MSEVRTVAVLATTRQVCDDLVALRDAFGGADSRFVPIVVGPGATVAELVERIESLDAATVCVDVDVEAALAVGLAVELRTRRPEVQVLTVASPSRVAAHVDGSGAAGRRVAVVLAPKGGSGKTTIAVNLAVALAERTPDDVVLVDLDALFGDAATVLGVRPERSLADLVGGDVDTTAVKVCLTRDERSGVYVLAAPDGPHAGERIRPELASSVVSILANEFGTVVVDTAAGLDDHALAAVDRATDLVLVAGVDVASIRNLRMAIDVLNGMDVPSSTRWLVVNHVEDGSGFALEEIETVLGLPVVVGVPQDRVVTRAADRGAPFVLDQPNSGPGRAVRGLASAFIEGPDGVSARDRVPTRRRGLLRRR